MSLTVFVYSSLCVCVCVCADTMCDTVKEIIITISYGSPSLSFDFFACPWR